MLSERASLAQQPSLPYFGLFLRSLSNLHSVDNPSGVVSFCVAENALSAPLVCARLREVSALPPPPGQLGYDNMRGRSCLLSAFSALAARLITGGAPVDPGQLCISSGCGALLQHLAFLLLDKGDCLLLATPTYPALYNDVRVLAGVQIEDVPVPPGQALTPAALTAACARATARGLRPRMLLLLHPENPLGTVRGSAELLDIVAWVDAQGPAFHLVSDEIYALSVYDPEGGAAFTSMASVRHAAAVAAAAAAAGSSATATAAAAAPLYLGSNTHILWGFSKDFCASGLRCGVLFTHSPALLSALDNVAYFAAVANPTQDALAAAIGDPAWVDAFLAANHAALREAREAVCSALSRAGVPHTRPWAGLYVWLDLSAWLAPVAPEGGSGGGSGAFSGERRLTEALLAAGVLMTPGEACHAPKPGCFRLCFAWHSSMESVRVGCERLVKFLAENEGGVF